MRRSSKWQCNTRWLKRAALYVTVLCSLWLCLLLFIKEGSSETTAVVILGGGVTKEGTVPEHTQLRLDLAFELFQQLGERAVFFPLSGGTPHKPNPVDVRGFPIWECTAAAKKLMEMGVPPEQIYEESTSLDTIGNAYFLRAVHMSPADMYKMIVITNDWHMPRTRAIFDFVFSLPHRSRLERSTMQATLRRWLGGQEHSISYLSAEAGISDAHLLHVRTEKEARALRQFHDNIMPNIRSFQALHRWLFTQHNAYSSSRLKNSHSSEIPADLLKTY
uniref:DUF218 domain-containing protein n=1 Tax=Spumella elongata TaxID=89044 RepID=A0A7S3GWL5_9STRA|mmetsp:Transcript_23146/g.40034  ORF Transcript_23146/g.40034 Transcript_23146/m.40034 type:complete len:276 (+) Transcript_23146:64-891(+)